MSKVTRIRRGADLSSQPRTARSAPPSAGAEQAVSGSRALSESLRASSSNTATAAGPLTARVGRAQKPQRSRLAGRTSPPRHRFGFIGGRGSFGTKA